MKKTIARDALSAYLDDLLTVGTFKDYTPNGLQVEGKQTVTRVVMGVTASKRLIEAAIDEKADAIIVHHGYFWKNEAPVIVGMKQQRIKSLLAHDINLFAYHLPLDAHATLGNNAQLARLWGIEAAAPVEKDSLLWTGRLPELSLSDFSQQVAQTLDRKPQVIAGGEHRIKTIAWCSGAAQGYIEAAKAAGADAFVSGEISEQTVHIAREMGIHYVAAGHHATERLGVQALGEHLKDRLCLDCIFIDCDNPV